MSKKNATISEELYKYLGVVLPAIDIFTIFTVAFTSANPWITTPINIFFPVTGIISTKLAIKMNRQKQNTMYYFVLPSMAVALGFFAYYAGTDSPAWVQVFPIITGALYLVSTKLPQILIALLCLVSLFIAYWLLGASTSLIISITLAIGAAAAIMERMFSYLKNQHSQLEEQKEEIEEKNHEIIDSITYAKRIQATILPTDKTVEALLPNAFVLFKPKDIVSGDFYWFHKTADSIMFAACDCTGHGVPGAMVSVVCSNSLNEAAKRLTAANPDLLLNTTREIVIEQFQKSEADIKDGMDISMCSLNNSGTELKWAGANNPLYIVRKGEILETKADKQPIGKHIDMKPFKGHTIELQKGDHIYIFTDGYHDQFGGIKGKKMKRTHFKEILIAVSKEPIEQQKELLNGHFEKWKATYEQIDDVCLIGVMIS